VCVVSVRAVAAAIYTYLSNVYVFGFEYWRAHVSVECMGSNVSGRGSVGGIALVSWGVASLRL